MGGLKKKSRKWCRKSRLPITAYCSYIGFTHSAQNLSMTILCTVLPSGGLSATSSRLWMKITICLSGGRLAFGDDQDVIWVCWFQGMEQAPELVRSCFSRLCAVETHRVILITEENMLQYADIPSSVLRKWKAGIIPNPNFSDILRTILLYQHGGLWIDATMLLAKPVPQYIWESPLFVFQYTENPLIFDAFSNHFMRGHAGDEFLGRVLYGMLRYWEKYNTLQGLLHLPFHLHGSSTHGRRHAPDLCEYPASLIRVQSFASALLVEKIRCRDVGLAYIKILHSQVDL